MKHSVAGGAAAILEKSRSRMRGQHFTSDGRGTSKKTEQPKQPSKNTEDDDIAVSFMCCWHSYSLMVGHLNKTPNCFSLPS